MRPLCHSGSPRLAEDFAAKSVITRCKTCNVPRSRVKATNQEAPVFDLKGRVAVVTGGNGGIGLGMARGLAGAGARIVVAGRNTEKSRAAVKELERFGGDPIAIDVDVTVEAQVDALVQQTVERCGRLDILVNNAGTRSEERRVGKEWRSRW